MRRDRVYGFLGCPHFLIFCPLSQGCCAVRRFLVCAWMGGWIGKRQGRGERLAAALSARSSPSEVVVERGRD